MIKGHEVVQLNEQVLFLVTSLRIEVYIKNSVIFSKDQALANDALGHSKHWREYLAK